MPQKKQRAAFMDLCTPAYAETVYPTLVENGSLFVETATLPENAKLEIFDMNGRKVFSKDLAQQSGRQQVLLTLPVKSTGSYVARVSGSREALLSQLIVIK